MIALRAAIVALALGGAAGCLPTLWAETAPPPGRTARLVAHEGVFSVDSYHLELSQGVAIAIGCHASGPCPELAASSDDPAIATVRKASLAALRPQGVFGNLQPAATVVVVGVGPGKTKIRLRSKAGDREVDVTVAPQPTAVSRAAP